MIFKTLFISNDMKILEREKRNEVNLELSPAYWPGSHGRRHGNRKEQHMETMETGRRNTRRSL